MLAYVLKQKISIACRLTISKHLIFILSIGLCFREELQECELSESNRGISGDMHRAISWTYFEHKKLFLKNLCYAVFNENSDYVSLAFE